MRVTDMFRCKPLEGSLSYRTCLLRRVSVMPGGGSDRFRYPECVECANGLRNSEKFPDFDAAVYLHGVFEGKRDRALGLLPEEVEIEK